VAETVLKICGEVPVHPSCICVGGGHYPIKFTDYVLKHGLGVGHICPKYNQNNLDKGVAVQMIEKTIPKPDRVLIDRKGTKGSGGVKSLFESLGLKTVYL